MNKSLKNRKVIEEAVDNLRTESRLPISIEEVDSSSDNGFDYLVTIAGIRFRAATALTISNGNKNLIYNQLRNYNQSNSPSIIISGYIPRAIAREFSSSEINYLDKAGNCCIRHGTLIILIEGKKIEPATRTNTSRAFQEAGIRIIFQLLRNHNHSPKLNLSYRELAEITDVSLGSVSSVMRELAELDFIFEANNTRVLKNTASLLDRWVIAYHDVLRPRLHLKQMRFAQPAQQWNLLPIKDVDDILLWSGEPAAALKTHQLYPEKFTLYTNGSWQEAMRLLKLVPAEDGNIELLDLFWNESDEYRFKEVVPPLLIYADLMGSRLGRNIEIANIIRQNELSYLL